MNLWDFLHAHADGIAWMAMIVALLVFLDRIISRFSGID